MKEAVINAEDCAVGRLASLVAKRLMNGEMIFIVNAEKAVITGDQAFTFSNYKQKTDRGDEYLGPFYPKYPDQIIKRTVRGMLPYNKPKGRKAFKSLKVFISVPDMLKKRDLETVERAKSNLKHKYSTLGDLSLKLGAKKKW